MQIRRSGSGQSPPSHRRGAQRGGERLSGRPQSTAGYLEPLYLGLLKAAGILLFLVLALLIYWIARDGAGAVSWEFLTQKPSQGMTAGGIHPAIMGTLYVSLGTMFISVPVGVAAAVYLHEYARPSLLTRLIRLCLRNLAGVPSIVYGLFGLGLFVASLELGMSLLAASLTLALLVLPWVVTSAEEALKTVPRGFRDGAHALGATRWQAIRHLVLPYALPGMVTGAILGLARAAGETAPILLTGAAFYLPSLPHSPLDRFMALPYHLYILSTQHHDISQVRPLAYGTALVLLALVLVLSAAAIYFRYGARRAKNW